MSKFKAGDKVRVLESGAEGSSVEVGDVGIHTGAGCKVNFPNDYWYLSDNFLELVEDESENIIKQEEKVMTQFKEGDQVIIKKDVKNGDFVFGLGEGMAEARDQGKILTVSEIVGSHRVVASCEIFEDGDYNFDANEIELVEELTSTIQPFGVSTFGLTSDQINEMLSLAVKAGAIASESANDSSKIYPELAETSTYTPTLFTYVGANKTLETGFWDTEYQYDNNILTYQEAIDMLTGTKTESKLEEVKVEQKPMMLKAFAVDCNEITAVQGNELAKLAAQAGAELVEGLEDDEMEADEAAEKYPEISDFCDREYYNYFGVDTDNQTYALDNPGCYDHNIMSYEDAINMLNKIINFKPEPKVQEFVEQKSSRKVKGKVPVLHQRKVKVTYTNDKTYLLKNVVSLDVHADSETVNVVYKEKKGKVQINSNVVIPFSELKQVSFVAPESVGAVYVFKAGKVVEVTLDHTREAFRTKSH